MTSRNRREFCRDLAAAGGALALTSILNACRTPLPAEESGQALAKATAARSQPTIFPTAAAQTDAAATWAPTDEATATTAPTDEATAVPQATSQPTAVHTLEPGVSLVALVRTTDRAAGVKKVLELLGVNPASGNRVLLKPNLNSEDPAPGSTHPDVLRTLVERLQDMGARSITIGERSGMGDTRRVMERTGVMGLAGRMGLGTAVFDELAEDDWVIRRSGEFHWSDGFAVPKILLDTECVVQTCNLKTHRYGGHFTMSLKNSVGFAAKFAGSGGYNYMTELHNSPYQRQMIAEINTVYRPALIVMDGVEAFVNGGPAQGDKVRPEVVLASTDAVAIDAVGVALLRIFGTTPAVSQGRIFEQAQIARAVELDLGVASAAQIRLITPNGDVESMAYAGRVQEVLAAG